MPRNVTVVCQREAGPPEQVVRVEKWGLPLLRPDQVLVEMKAAPINPADLNVLEGKYPVPVPLPRVVGNEGVGVVTAVGSTVTNLRVGQHVIAPIQLGSWCEARVLDANGAYAVPTEIPIEQAAMLAVNPPTAWRMLHDFAELKAGDWVIQNAANSAVGRFVIQIARQLGLRSVNMVRRPELIEELKREGADLVVVADGAFSKSVKEETGGAAIRLGLNAVGGDNARELAKCLAPGGTLVTYGAMSREPLRIDNAALIFKDVRFRGFWISEWFRRTARARVEEMFAALQPLLAEGRLRAPIEQTFPLTAARDAVAHASRCGRRGKVLFRV